MNSCCALLVSMTLAIGQAPVSENLKVLEPLIGTWEGTIAMPSTPVADDNPTKLKGGQKVPVIGTYSWGENGQSVDLRVAFLVDGVEKPFTNGVMMWCPKEKAIIGYDSYASGTHVRYTITRDGNHFHWDLEGVEADGDATSSKIDATITPDGKHVSRWTEQISGGTRLPDGEEIVLRRVDTTSSREEFETFCKAWKGLWVSSKPLEADTLGVGKKGDNVTEYANCDVVDNGNTMICSGYTADGSNTWVVTYDAHKKQLKTTWSTSSGISASGRIYRRGEQWINPSVGCKPDGTKVTYNHVITISDQGDTHTWDGKVSPGNDPVVETQQVYHRISR